MPAKTCVPLIVLILEECIVLVSMLVSLVVSIRISIRKKRHSFFEEDCLRLGITPHPLILAF